MIQKQLKKLFRKENSLASAGKQAVASGSTSLHAACVSSPCLYCQWHPGTSVNILTYVLYVWGSLHLTDKAIL